VEDKAADELRVTLVQHASSLDPEVNLAFLDSLVQAAAGSDLVVLPEASARDFGEPGSDLRPFAEPMDGPYARSLHRLGTDTLVVAGMFERTDGLPFNTLVATGPGVEASYRKIHLYDSFGFKESDTIAAGPVEPVPVTYAGARIGLMTCYDLRFPELARALAVDVIVIPAAWVAGPRKLAHWTTLVRARAIENVAWVVAVGQPGPRYTGHSMVVAPTGDVLAEAGEGEEQLSVTLDLALVASTRRSNPSLANRRM